MHHIVNCARNSKIALTFKYAKRFSRYWSKQQFECSIHNLTTTWSTKIPMPFLSSLDNLSLRCMHYFSRKCWQFEIAQKHAYWCSTPLMQSSAFFFFLFFFFFSFFFSFLYIVNSWFLVTKTDSALHETKNLKTPALDIFGKNLGLNVKQW